MTDGALPGKKKKKGDLSSQLMAINGGTALNEATLSKKSFPVGRVGKKTASREVGIFFFFFFPNFNFLKIECTGRKVTKKNFF